MSHQGWSKLNANTIEKSTKDIVFMLGENLKQGPQIFTEIKVPYQGTINNLLISIGNDSTNQSNLIIGLEKLDSNGSWKTIKSVQIQPDQKFNNFPTNIDINKDKLRITLVSGDFGDVTTMSIIAQLNVD